MKNFAKNIKGEFKKISWPTKDKLLKETSTALILTLVLTLLIFFFDSGFSWICNYIMSLF